MPDRKIVTRFAPSPTGYLHVGGARTALFNWAFARRHGGTFVLRIEDTDVARSTGESTRRIIQDMLWLGLEWDEGPDPAAADQYAIAGQKGEHGPYFQSQRGALYQQYLQQLVDSGRAYRCFKSQVELKAQREEARAQGKPEKYDPADSLGLSDEQQQQLIASGVPYVWRFKMPGVSVTVPDAVLGDVTIAADQLEDFVIFKSDGGPTFHFANIVDDATMGISHVLRAQEHLMNTPKHIALQDALGLPHPTYAHMPLIFNPDNTKMSKRDKAKTARQGAQLWLKQHNNDRAALLALLQKKGSEAFFPARAPEKALEPEKASDPFSAFSASDLGLFLEKKSDDNAIAAALAAALSIELPEIDVHDFRASGYLREVLLNYVALLGWSPGADLERFDLDYLRREFDLERLGKTNARFDRAKLLAFNAQSILQLSPEEFRTRLGQHLQQFHPEFAAIASDPARLSAFAAAYQVRARTLSEPAKSGRFFIIADDQLIYDPKAVDKVLRKGEPTGLAVLEKLLPRLEAAPAWTGPALHHLIEGFAQELGKGINDVAQPVRVAVSGGTVSPSIHDTLVILGKASSLARIRRCLALLAA